MQICEDHWRTMRQAIEDRGMSGLVPASGEEAVRRLASDKGEADTFDPLMDMHNFFTTECLSGGGLYLMGVDKDGKQYCPLCECHLHTGRNIEQWIDTTADSMRVYALESGLIKNN